MLIKTWRMSQKSRPRRSHVHIEAQEDGEILQHVWIWILSNTYHRHFRSDIRTALDFGREKEVYKNVYTYSNKCKKQCAKDKLKSYHPYVYVFISRTVHDFNVYQIIRHEHKEKG